MLIVLLIVPWWVGGFLVVSFFSCDQVKGLNRVMSLRAVNGRSSEQGGAASLGEECVLVLEPNPSNTGASCCPSS